LLAEAGTLPNYQTLEKQWPFVEVYIRKYFSAAGKKDTSLQYF
jgi:hypothetical protein